MYTTRDEKGRYDGSTCRKDFDGDTSAEEMWRVRGHSKLNPGNTNQNLIKAVLAARLERSDHTYFPETSFTTVESRPGETRGEFRRRVEEIEQQGIDENFADRSVPMVEPCPLLALPVAPSLALPNPIPPSTPSPGATVASPGRRILYSAPDAG